MFLKRFALLSLSAVAALGASFGVVADDAELEAVRTKVAEMFAVIEREDVGPGPIDGWFTIQRGAVIAYVSSDGRYLLQGDVIDLDANVNLTEQTRNVSRREMVAPLVAEKAIVFSPKEPKHSVTVFTDIDCGYCRRLHNQIEQYMAKGIEVRYLLYPRNGPSSESWATSEKVWCSADRQAALTNAKRDREFEAVDCDTNVVAEHYELGRRIGLNGTPAIVLENGELLGGYLPPEALAQRLAEISSERVAAN